MIRLHEQGNMPRLSPLMEREKQKHALRVACGSYRMNLIKGVQMVPCCDNSQGRKSLNTPHDIHEARLS